MKDVVIVEAVRTAVGTFGGTLKPLNADVLAAEVMSAAVERAGVEKGIVEEICFGHCRQTSDFSNTARYAALLAGFPEEVPGNTVMCACASAMLATRNVVNLIRGGDIDVGLAGGAESMTNGFFYMPNARWGVGTGTTELRDSLTESQFRSQPIDKYGRFNMGMTAENVAERMGITREEQDEFAFNSQQKAAAAIAAGRFKDEIVPITVPQGRKKDPIVFDTDEFPKNSPLEVLAKLKPAFKEGGTVTPGNSSGRNDGSSALLLMSAEKAASMNLKPLAVIRGVASAGLDPRYMGLGPVPATKRVMEKTGMKLDDMQLIELNEAFAAQSIGCIREMGLTDRMDIINVNGGAIALGHPIGSSGARIIVTLVHELRKRSLKYGLATLCIGGGMGMATIVEAL